MQNPFQCTGMGNEAHWNRHCSALEWLMKRTAIFNMKGPQK